jgi:hypothetical protein
MTRSLLVGSLSLLSPLQVDRALSCEAVFWVTPATEPRHD